MTQPISQRRRTLSLALLGAALPAAPLLAAPGPAYPSRLIRLVVPQAAGSGSDVVARLVGERLGEQLRQPVVVENRPGASGQIAHQYVLGQPADGHTLIMSSTANLLIVPAMARRGQYRNTAKFRHTDFTPVAALLESPYVIVVANEAGRPASLQALQAQARSMPLTFVSAGTGSMGHLGAELILGRAGNRERHVHVPYKGSAQALADLAGGQAHFAVDTVLATEPLLKAGRLRALAVTSGSRLEALPNVPTLREAGLDGVEIRTRAGIFAPAGVSRDVAVTIGIAMARVLSEPAVRSTLKSLGNEPLMLTPDQYKAAIAAEAPGWDKLVERLDLRLD